MNTRFAFVDLGPRLRLLQFASQALPTGAFAYSCGLESLHDMGSLQTEESCIVYLQSYCKSTVCYLELPVFLRMFDAFSQDMPAVARHWSVRLLAYRESREQQEQERQMARALGRVLSVVFPDLVQDWEPHSFVEGMAKAAVLSGMDSDDACALLSYSWIEQQVSALCRILPLGPMAGQRLLSGALLAVPDAVREACAVDDEDIGASAPRLALASALHETQYTRIFRS